MSNVTSDLSLSNRYAVLSLSSDEDDTNIEDWCVTGENNRKETTDYSLYSPKGTCWYKSVSYGMWSVSSNENHVKLNRLYIRLQKELIKKFDLNKYAIKKAIDHLVYNYTHVFRGKMPSEINYNDMNNCVGYLQKYASCHAALVHDEIRKLFKTPPIEVSLLSLFRQFNIVCLGSGPGNDLVGFLNALYGHVNLHHLDITVVDKMPGWARVFSHTVKMLKENVHLGGKVSLMFKEIPEITTSFIAADLVNAITWSKKMEQKLTQADAILLVKVLSNIQEEKKLITLKNIVDRMKPGALLFFIDCPELPEETFEIDSSLKNIFRTEVTRFVFKCEDITHCNLTSCQAAVSVLALPRQPKQELPNFNDETEWPKLE